MTTKNNTFAIELSNDKLENAIAKRLLKYGFELLEITELYDSTNYEIIGIKTKITSRNTRDFNGNMVVVEGLFKGNAEQYYKSLNKKNQAK